MVETQAAAALGQQSGDRLHLPQLPEALAEVLRPELDIAQLGTDVLARGGIVEPQDVRQTAAQEHQVAGGEAAHMVTYDQVPLPGDDVQDLHLGVHVVRAIEQLLAASMEGERGTLGIADFLENKAHGSNSVFHYPVHAGNRQRAAKRVSEFESKAIALGAAACLGLIRPRQPDVGRKLKEDGNARTLFREHRSHSLRGAR